MLNCAGRKTRSPAKNLYYARAPTRSNVADIGINVLSVARCNYFLGLMQFVHVSNEYFHVGVLPASTLSVMCKPSVLCAKDWPKLQREMIPGIRPAS